MRQVEEESNFGGRGGSRKVQRTYAAFDLVK
jgi:hypothetical protein